MQADTRSIIRSSSFKLSSHTRSKQWPTEDASTDLPAAPHHQSTHPHSPPQTSNHNARDEHGHRINYARSVRLLDQLHIHPKLNTSPHRPPHRPNPLGLRLRLPRALPVPLHHLHHAPCPPQHPLRSQTHRNSPRSTAPPTLRPIHAAPPPNLHVEIRTFCLSRPSPGIRARCSRARFGCTSRDGIEGRGGRGEVAEERG